MIILYVLLSLLAIVFTVLLYIFFAPFYIEVDSNQSLYRLRLASWAWVRIFFENNNFFAEIRVFWFKKAINLSATATKKQNKQPAKIEVKPIRKKEKQKNRKKIPLSKIKSILKSFTVKKCRLQVDTGDVALNGILYPIFFLIGFYTRQQININFEERNEFELALKNSLAKMCLAYLKK